MLVVMAGCSQGGESSPAESSWPPDLCADFADELVSDAIMQLHICTLHIQPVCSISAGPFVILKSFGLYNKINFQPHS